MQDDSVIDGPAAWRRLAVALLASTIGGVGMWSVVVVLPAVQAEFGADRAGASLPYTLTMLGFGAGGILLGRLADKRGIALVVAGAGVAICAGFLLTAISTSLWQFAIAHGLLIGGMGCAATFGPLMADTSLWFRRRRGIAVTVCASGNYLSGTLWPPIVGHFVGTVGWRATHVGVGLFCLATLLPLAWLLRARPPRETTVWATPGSVSGIRPLHLAPGTLQALLIVAGVGCCVAMSMPQVHIVAYCGDLGYGPVRGTQMLSLMLGFGIVSRVGSGFIADRIGGLPTLMLGSALQGLALLLYLGFSSLPSLFVISALFGLFQGGIVPSYAIIVREYFPPSEAGGRIGVVIMATLVGMALGGWLSGEIFDLTGSYQAAFANGVLWNLLNGGIVLTLLLRRRRAALAPA